MPELPSSWSSRLPNEILKQKPPVRQARLRSWHPPATWAAPPSASHRPREDHIHELRVTRHPCCACVPVYNVVQQQRRKRGQAGGVGGPRHRLRPLPLRTFAFGLNSPLPGPFFLGRCFLAHSAADFSNSVSSLQGQRGASHARQPGQPGTT